MNENSALPPKWRRWLETGIHYVEIINRITTVILDVVEAASRKPGRTEDGEPEGTDHEPPHTGGNDPGRLQPADGEDGSSGGSS